MATPQVTDIMRTFNTPQYTGELFTAAPKDTPLLSMIGGLTGGKQTNNFEFPTAVLYDYPEPEQPEISENASIIAPEPTFIQRSQEKNVVQLFHEAISITYMRQSNSGRMEGINQANDSPNPPTELDWQIRQRLIKVARDVEYTFLNGSYQLAPTTNDANKTRGILELIQENAIDAGDAPLTKEMLNAIFKLLADNGAYLDNIVMMVNSTLKQKITDIYSSQFNGFRMPETRSIGGLNIQTIENDFFEFGITYNKFMPQDTVLLADVAHIAPVFQTVPGRGNFFLEELAKTGAATKYQLFGQIGLAHGPEFLHGKITGVTA